MAEYSQVFNARELVAFYEKMKASYEKKYGLSIGREMFPSVTIPGLDIKWIKGRNKKNVVLKPSTFGEKASRRDRIGVSKVTTEMPFFREAMVIDEGERQKLMTLLSNNNDIDFVMSVMMNLYEEHAGLIRGAEAQEERMIMALLSVGEINIKSNANDGRTNNYTYVYDDEAGSWKTNNNVIIAGNAKWTKDNAATSDPVTDILDAIQTHKEKHGTKTAKLLMNSVTLKGILSSDSIKKTVRPLGGVLRRREGIDFIEDESEATIIIHDGVFQDEQGTDKKFFPDGYLTLLPDEPVGKLYNGTTPEAFNYLNNKSNRKPDVAIMKNGITVMTIAENHPVNYETIVSHIALPSYEGMDDVFVVKGF